MAKPARDKVLIDVSVALLVSLISFYGQYLSEFMNILKNPLWTTDILITVIFFHNIWNIFTNRSKYQAFTPNILLSFIHTVLFLILSSVGFHILIVIFGAPFLKNVSETFHLALLLTSATFVPLCCILGLNRHEWSRVMLLDSVENTAELTAQTTTRLSLLGAWLGAFPIPLDWDRPWQVWPITCVLGTSLGYAAGLVISHLLFIFNPRSISEKSKLG